MRKIKILIDNTEMVAAEISRIPLTYLELANVLRKLADQINPNDGEITVKKIEVETE